MKSVLKGFLFLPLAPLALALSIHSTIDSRDLILPGLPNITQVGANSSLSVTNLTIDTRLNCKKATGYPMKADSCVNAWEKVPSYPENQRFQKRYEINPTNYVLVEQYRL